MKKIIVFNILIILLFLTSCVNNKTQTTQQIYCNNSEYRINSSNYYDNSVIDCDSNNIYQFKNGIFENYLQVINLKGKLKKIRNIDYPFRVKNNRLFYITDDNKLRIMEINTEKIIFEEKTVYNFKLFKNYLIYSKDIDENNTKIIAYNLDDKSKKTIINQNYDIFADNDYLYLINLEKIYKISDDLKIDRSFNVIAESYPYDIKFSNDKTLFIGDSYCLYLVDKSTGKIETLKFSENGLKNDKISVVCDDYYLYFSFQKTKTNGSVVSNVYDKDNGLWRLDLKTKEKEKLLDGNFEDIFLYNSNILLASKNNKLYSIDLNNKTIDKIS